MRPVLICPDDLLEHVVTAAAFPGERPLYLVSRASLRARLVRRGDRATAGKVTDATFLHQAFKGGRGPVVVAAPAGQLARVIAAVKDAAPDAPLLVLRDDDRPLSNATVVPLSAFGERIVQPALDRATQRARAERLRAHFYDAERVLILMQDDPDPDAIASALALKTLLGRTRASAPICTFGTITRPENVAMCKILEIEVEAIDARGARPVRPRGHGGRAALVPRGGEALRRGGPGDRSPPGRAADPGAHQGRAPVLRGDLHHPGRVPARGRRQDHASGWPPPCSTASSPTPSASSAAAPRPTSRPSRILYLLANHNALRRIERPELSRDGPRRARPGPGPAARGPRRVLLAPGPGRHRGPRSPSSPTSGCRPRASSGRWSPAWWTTRCTSPSATWATCGARAT